MFAAPAMARDGFDLSHLHEYVETVSGPVQRDEAVLLHGLIRVIRPQTVVELGFQRGQSAFNFLRALDRDARLYSVDMRERWRQIADARFGHDPRFKFVLKRQESIDPQDFEGRPIDFLFIDASHDLELNQASFLRLLPMLSPSAIIGIHDTGTVPRHLFLEDHWLLDTPENWVGDEYEGQPGERAFVNWLLDEHSEFAQIHLHSDRTVRCGITLVQRIQRLARPDELLAGEATTGAD